MTTGQVGGGPWIISRHSKNSKAAADFVTWATTVFNPTGKDARGGYPAYAPLADKWLETQATNPYFAADPTPALKAAASQIWSGLEPGDLPRPAGLVEHRRHQAGGRLVTQLVAATPR